MKQANAMCPCMTNAIMRYRRDELHAIIPSLMDAMHAIEVASAAQVPCGASIEIDMESCGSPNHQGWQQQVVCDQDSSSMNFHGMQAKRGLGACNIYNDKYNIRTGC